MMIGWQIYFWVMVVLNVIGLGIHITREGEARETEFYSIGGKLLFMALYAPAFVILFKYIYNSPK
jgi:hypothetical protein